MSIVSKYRQPQVSQEGFFDVFKKIFGIKSEAYSNIKTLDELLSKLKDRLTEVTKAVDGPMDYKVELNLADKYRDTFSHQRNITELKEILSFIELNSQYPKLVSQYDQSHIKPLLGQVKSTYQKWLKHKDDEDFDGRVFFPGEGSKSLFKDTLFQSCEKELSDKKYSSLDLDWSRTPIYFRSNYVVVGANHSNLYANKLSANRAAVRQNFFSGCIKPREALKYVKTFIEDSQYFLSSNGFLTLAQWVESTNGTDRPYYLDDYISNVGYLSMEIYEEFVRLAKHIARGMLVTLDWVEESLVEQPSLESLCLGV